MFAGSKPTYVKALSVSLVVFVSWSGCVSYRPKPAAEVPFMERAQTQEDGDVKVTAAVLSDKEGREVFGVPLAKKGVQALWLKIENRSGDPYVFLLGSVDPNYYSSDEVAFLSHFSVKKKILEMGLFSVLLFPAILGIPFEYAGAKIANRKMDQIFSQHALPNDLIGPGETVSGFMFTPLDEGSKEITFSLHGSAAEKKFSFFIKIPGIKADYTHRDFFELYADKDFVTFENEKDLAEALRKLPCCTTDERGRGEGDPLNLVMIGDPEDVWIAFTASRWDETELLNFKSAFKMFKSVLLGHHYRYSPMSALYYEGRSQDVSLQKARETVKSRLHLRLWYTPMKFQGKPVWVGTVSRDIGIRMSFKHWYLTDHVIDPNIDDARESILADLINDRRVSHYGFVSGTEKSTKDKPKKNLSGNQYYTDGYRMVLAPSAQRSSSAVFVGWDMMKDPDAADIRDAASAALLAGGA